MTAFYFVFPTADEAYDAMPSFDSDAARELRQRAIDSRQRAEDSFQRCDTDGFLSQWALGINALDDEEAARLADQANLIIKPVLVDIASGDVVAACVHILPSRFHYGNEYKWIVHRNGSKQYVTDYKREATFEKLGLRKAWAMAPAALYGRLLGDHTPEKRGLSGCASYHGKSADFDYNASGLPRP